MYLLRTSPASPFGRKVVLAAATCLADQLVIQPVDVNNPHDSLLQQNPLGKIPALITRQGQTLFDQRVIIEFLDDKAGGGVVIPRGDSRWEVLRQQALADGLMDAALPGCRARYVPVANKDNRLCRTVGCRKALLLLLPQQCGWDRYSRPRP